MGLYNSFLYLPYTDSILHIFSKHFKAEVPKTNSPYKVSDLCEASALIPLPPGDRPFSKPEQKAPPVTLHRRTKKGELFLLLLGTAPQSAEIGGTWPDHHWNVVGEGAHRKKRQTTHVYLYRSYTSVSKKETEGSDYFS